MHEGIPIINYHVPKAFIHEAGQLKGMTFEVVRAEYDDSGRRKLVRVRVPEARAAANAASSAIVRCAKRSLVLRRRPAAAAAPTSRTADSESPPARKKSSSTSA